jgi:hypothetical protein
MEDIFLSYAREDREVAAQITAQLEALGWSVWWDREIPAGKTWRQLIEDALKNMRCLVVLWSNASIQSDWVREEADEGRSQGKLIPVLIENVRPPIGFRELQAADLVNWDGSAKETGFQKLVKDIEALLGKAPIDLQTRGAKETRAQTRETINTARPTIDASPGREKGAELRVAPAWWPWAALAAVVILALIAAPHLRRDPVRLNGAPASSSIEQAKPSPHAPDYVPRANEAINDGGATEGEEKVKRAYAVKAPLAIERATVKAKEASSKSFVAEPALPSANMAASRARCNELLERLQVGEPISESDRAWLQRECR